MVRLALLLLVASGCDLVLQISRPPPVACGPYGAPEPLVFAPMIEEPRGFSVRSDGVGAVHARVRGRTHAYILEQDATGTWGLHADPARNVGLGDVSDASIGERDLAGVEELYGSTGDPARAYGYLFAGAAWGTSSNPVEQDTEFDVTVGNVVEVVDEINDVPVAQRKRAVVTLVPDDGVGKNLIRFVDLLAPYEDRLWNDDPERTAPINADLELSPSQGVLTSDLLTLVYAARRAGGSSDLFVARRNDADKQWYPGTKIAGVDTELDELEPWIDGDCSTLYFERDGVTYRTERVDE